MAKKGKAKGKIDVGKLIRSIARERIGSPGKEKVVPDRRRKKLDEIREREDQEELL
jgi:hypothetical protein